MFKQGIYAAIIAGLMMTGMAHAGGASPQTKPPSPTMEAPSGGGNGRVIGTNKDIYDGAETASFVIKWPYVYSKSGTRYCKLNSDLRCGTAIKSCRSWSGQGINQTSTVHKWRTHNFVVSLEDIKYTHKKKRFSSGCATTHNETNENWTK